MLIGLGQLNRPSAGGAHFPQIGAASNVTGEYDLLSVSGRLVGSGYQTRGFSWHDSNFLVNGSNLTYVRAGCYSLKVITTCELGVLRV
jgi:hypothetical protein